MPVLTARSHPALRWALKGAVYLALFTFVTEFMPLSGPAIAVPPLSRLLAGTAFSLLAGGFAGAAYGAVLGRAERHTFSAHVRAGVAGGGVFGLSAIIAGRQLLSARWLLVVVAAGVLAGAVFGVLRWVQDLADEARPAA